jgi:hypothetical protein
MLSTRIDRAAALASARLAQTNTPLPAARPSALTTNGLFRALVNVAFGIGIQRENRKVGSGDTGTTQQFLGENLAALQPGGGS